MLEEDNRCRRVGNINAQPRGPLGRGYVPLLRGKSESCVWCSWSQVSTLQYTAETSVWDFAIRLDSKVGFELPMTSLTNSTG